MPADRGGLANSRLLSAKAERRLRIMVQFITSGQTFVRWCHSDAPITHGFFGQPAQSPPP
jgi:hypothetical protein